MTEVYIDPFILLIRKARAEGRAEGLAEAKAEIDKANAQRDKANAQRDKANAENDKLKSQLQAMYDKFGYEPQDMHL